MRVLNAVLSVLIIIALLLVVAFALPGLFGIQPFAITSASMVPKYPVGSLIYVKSVDADDVHVGDAITFYMADSDIVATHEVWEIDVQNKQFRTQGINNTDQNGNILHDASPVAFGNLIGRPVLCIPLLGYVNRFCTTPPGIYILLIIVVIVVALSLVIDMLAPKHKKRKN